jgi:peptidoglycan/LPS O-acetylase OafA/YrhL
LGVIAEYTVLFNKEGDAEVDETNPEKHKSKLGLIFLSFSITRNVRKLFWTRKPAKDDYLTVFNGVRVLSICYVMLGHAYGSIFIHSMQKKTQNLKSKKSPRPIAPVTNIINMFDYEKPWLFEIVPGGFYAVDVFFFLSAYLGAYLMLLKFYSKKNQ